MNDYTANNGGSSPDGNGDFHCTCEHDGSEYCACILMRDANCEVVSNVTGIRRIEGDSYPHDVMPFKREPRRY